LSRSHSGSPSRRLQQENYGNVTLGEKMRMALSAGKENLGDEVFFNILDEILNLNRRDNKKH